MFPCSLHFFLFFLQRQDRFPISVFLFFFFLLFLNCGARVFHLHNFLADITHVPGIIINYHVVVVVKKIFRPISVILNISIRIILF